jgi:hypothetical protein
MIAGFWRALKLDTHRPSGAEASVKHFNIFFNTENFIFLLPLLVVPPLKCPAVPHSMCEAPIDRMRMNALLVPPPTRVTPPTAAVAAAAAAAFKMLMQVRF